MSNDQDNDDWSHDSASLFREARRAHDPTLAESARLAAVFERLQAAKTEGSLETTRGVDPVARATTSQMLRLVASVSLGVVCIAAAAFAFIRIYSHPSERAQRPTPAPTTVASTPPPIAAQPARLPSSKLGPAEQVPAVRDEPQARPRKPSRRWRATSEGPQVEATSEPEAPSRTAGAALRGGGSLAAPPEKPNVSLSDNSATHDERGNPRATENAAAVTQRAVGHAPSSESEPDDAVTATPLEAEPTLLEDTRTELAMMKRIQAALRDADYSTVLELCAEHARRWPHGVFELEREGVRAIASCGDNSDDATLRAKGFLKAHPRAPVAMRVSAACAAQLIRR